MSQPHLQTVPKQSVSAYRLLNGASELTAKQISEKLNILPNAVYRAMKPLVGLGMVEQLDGYPLTYKANPTTDAMNWYLRAAAQSFRKDFGSLNPKPVDDSFPSITFIKDRKQLLTITEKDARSSKRKIDYIVSGHRIPDSTVLAYRKASICGVKIRCIVQNNPESTNADLEMYQEMGAEVRYLPNIGIRLFIYDGNIAVMTSYDEMQSSRAFGVRFTHTPVAQQLDQLFEQRWEEAQPLSK